MENKNISKLLKTSIAVFIISLLCQFIFSFFKLFAFVGVGLEYPRFWIHYNPTILYFIMIISIISITIFGSLYWINKRKISKSYKKYGEKTYR